MVSRFVYLLWYFFGQYTSFWSWKQILVLRFDGTCRNSILHSLADFVECFGEKNDRSFITYPHGYRVHRHRICRESNTRINSMVSGKIRHFCRIYFVICLRKWGFSYRISIKFDWNLYRFGTCSRNICTSNTSNGELHFSKKAWIIKISFFE